MRHLATSIFACAAVACSSTGCGDNPRATEPGPPSGGLRVELDYDAYVRDVAPIMQAQGCSATGDCHGGGLRGTFELSPVGAEDYAFDFDQVALQVDPYTLLESPLLTKPLAETAGGVPHSHEPFASTDDIDFTAIRDWVLDGEVQ